MLCVGPGLTTHPETVALVQRLIMEIDKPLVLDADGLNALALQPDIIAKRAAESARAPDFDAASRRGGPAAEHHYRGGSVRPCGAVRELATRYHAVAVLKGRYTLIADADGDIIINTTGNPGMATGGAGDTLTGIIGGLLAQDVAPVDKSSENPAKNETGEYIGDERKRISGRAETLDDENGSPGRIRSWRCRRHGGGEKTGEAGLVAGDIIAYLGRALRQLEETR